MADKPQKASFPQPGEQVEAVKEAGAVKEVGASGSRAALLALFAVAVLAVSIIAAVCVHRPGPAPSATGVPPRPPAPLPQSGA